MTEEGMSEGFEVLVRGPRGRVDALTVPCPRILVGSGAHCEVRLPMEHAAVEHVELTVSGGRVHARARAFDPPPTLGGSPFVQAFVEPGAAIGIGPFQLVATPIVHAGPSEPSRARRRLRSPLAVGVALGTLALVTAAFLEHRAGASAGPPLEPPALWGAATEPCPQTVPARALALARERRTLAEGKRERRPFQVRDGVAAVPLFETAAACYAVGGDGDTAAEMSRAADELRAQVQEDYHAHQVRLEHALLVHDSRTALRETTVLRAFTEETTGAYAAWLSDLDRRLQLELAKEHTS